MGFRESTVRSFDRGVGAPDLERAGDQAADESQEDQCRREDAGAVAPDEPVEEVAARRLAGFDRAALPPALEVVRELARRSVSLRGVDRGGPSENGVQIAPETPAEPRHRRPPCAGDRPGALGGQRAETLGGLGKRLVLDADDRPDGLAFEVEGEHTRQQLVQQETERVDVRSGVQLVVVGESGGLRAHVRGRTGHELAGGLVVVHRLSQGPSDAEVDHLDGRPSVDLGHEEIRRLEIAVEDAFLVGVPDSGTGSEKELDPLVQPVPAAIAPVGDRFAVDPLHGDEGSAPFAPRRVADAELEEGRHVRVREPGERLGLRRESLAPPGKGETLDQLERDGSSDRFLLLREVDGAHSAFPQHAVESVRSHSLGSALAGGRGDAERRRRGDLACLGELEPRCDLEEDRRVLRQAGLDRSAETGVVSTGTLQRGCARPPHEVLDVADDPFYRLRVRVGQPTHEASPAPARTRIASRSRLGGRVPYSNPRPGASRAAQ